MERAALRGEALGGHLRRWRSSTMFRIACVAPPCICPPRASPECEFIIARALSLEDEGCLMNVAVIGAGPAGITAAYQLAKSGVPVTVFESEKTAGGLSRSFELWGQRVDLGPHRFFSSDPRVNKLWYDAIGDQFHIVNRLTRIYYRHSFFYYPLKPANALWNLGIMEACRCLASYLRTKIRRKCNPDSFESWVVDRFGWRLYEMFFKSYTEKLWGIPCADLDMDFAAQRIKKFSLGEAVKSAFALGAKKHKTLVDCFSYPIEGAGMVYRRMAERVVEMKGEVLLGCPVEKILHHDRRITHLQLADGRTFPCDHVISTMPLTQLVSQCGPLPPDVDKAISELKYRNTLLVYLHVDGTNLFPDQWLYVHSPELGVGRVTNFRNWIPELYGEKRTTILALEYWCNNEDLLWTQSDADLIALGTQEIRSTGLLGQAAVLDGCVHRIPRSYPVYRRGYKDHLALLIKHLGGFANLTPIGRNGGFKYNNQDHSILMGLLAAENLLKGAYHDLWAINTDYEYQEGAESGEGKQSLADWTYQSATSRMPKEKAV
jgi:protoporphyrinogen oxidase